MFTTQHRVTRSPLSITPRTDGQTSRSTKGKAVSFYDGPPPPAPPLGLLNENGVNAAAEHGDLDDWLRFKEAGLLDGANMERKDREALIEKTARLEKELFDYQYNMGLLLIENKELTANTEELKEALAETREVVKREEAAHFMAVSEVERQADNLRKALDVEKRCRADLEKALREIDEENKQIKLKSHTNLADANTLIAGIGDKSREVEEKMREADKKLAEANKKSFELNIRIKELETHESVLRNERRSFISERERWEATYSRHKDDLQEWERKLQEGEERLCEGRKNINLREEKVNEIERFVKKREKELEEAHNKIESSILASKKKEDDVNKRLLSLITNEKQAQLIKKYLEVKEKELLDLTEKLTAKEQIEIQKLLDTHKNALDSERREFDLEIEEKRKSFENDIKSKIEAVEQKESEINYKEEKLKKLEQALENKSDRFKEKEKDYNTKLNALKENEKSHKAEAKKVETEKKQLLTEHESFQLLKKNTEEIRDEIAQKEVLVREEIEKLRITEDERRNYTRLQLELKEEMEKYMIQKELIVKELEDLSNDRVKFEREWEDLDEKRSNITKELTELDERRKNWENFQQSENEKLKKDKLNTEEYVKEELEAVRLEKELFADTMDHERSVLFEKAENERRQFRHEFEIKKSDLEAGFKKCEMEMVKKLEQREKEFEEERERERNNISFLKESIEKEFEEMKTEKQRIENEKNEFFVNKQQLEENQLEISNDINELSVLSKKIKNQREEFMDERSRFLEFVDQLKNCVNCCEIISNYEISDMQFLEVKGDLNEIIDNTSLENGGLVSWLKKGVTVFKLAPHRKTGELPETPHRKTGSDDVSRNGSKIHELPEGSQQSEMRSIQKTGELPETPHRKTGDDNISEKRSKIIEVPEGSQQSEMRSGRKKLVGKRKGPVVSENTLKGPGLGYVNEESVGVSSYVEERAGPSTKKRARAQAQSSVVSGSEMDGGESESESITIGGRRKRRQMVAPAVEATGEKRYNLRRHNNGDIASQTRASVGNRKKKEVMWTSGTETVTQNPEITSNLGTGVASEEGNTTTVHVTTSKHIDTRELNTDFKEPGDIVGASVRVELENIEITEEINKENDCNDNDHGDDDDDDDGRDDDSGDDDDDGSKRHPGEISIGKKIWTFLST